MKNSIGLLWCYLVLLAVLNVPVVAQSISSGNGPIRGAVSDAQGRSVSGARVSLTRTGSPASETKTTTTDDGGQFAFSDVGPVQYELRVSASGFADFIRTVDTVLST